MKIIKWSQAHACFDSSVLLKWILKIFSQHTCNIFSQKCSFCRINCILCGVMKIDTYPRCYKLAKLNYLGLRMKYIHTITYTVDRWIPWVYTWRSIANELLSAHLDVPLSQAACTSPAVVPGGVPAPAASASPGTFGRRRSSAPPAGYRPWRQRLVPGTVFNKHCGQAWCPVVAETTNQHQL